MHIAKSSRQKNCTRHNQSQLHTSETLASKGTNQRKEKACPEPEDLEEDTLDAVVDDKILRKIIPTLPFTFQLDRNLKPEDWKDMYQVLQLHHLLKDPFQWSMDNKRFNLGSHWEELGASCQKICLKEIDFKYLMEITKGWNPTKQFRLLEDKPALQWLHTIQEPADQWQRVTIIHNLRKFPGEVKDTRAKTRPFLTNSITPTQNEHSVLTPEIDLKSDEMLLQMAQYAEQTQKKFEELQESHERMKKLTASMDKIVKVLQEGHAQLRKSSEETNKLLSQVFEEQHH
ncbi:hypothetical protein O181_112797 [Austropuccinia psidii MF-1]|uniref:Uncharacterized protein n=1 Tax=Austropuccinia psidii MF-1 TaxID=1389203 RepID=A0A9Q3PUQ3_9BASI|nr:hypothetical protein [Austropuccinia psidii MF-1]